MPTHLGAQLASAQIQSMAESFGPPALAQGVIAQQMRSIVGLSDFVKHQNLVLAQLRPIVDVARSASIAVRAFEDVVRVSRGLSFDRIEWAARTTGWAVHTGVVLSEPGEDEIVRLEAEAITSLGPLTPSTELRALLTKLYPSLPEKLDGARERISRGGPDAVAQAATSLQEALDWTLRLLAPEGDVLAWHASERRLPSDLRNGHPTRPLRVRYIVRGHPEKQSSVGLYLKVLPELLQAIERHKHGLIQPPRRYMEPLAKMLESILQCLLTD